MINKVRFTDIYEEEPLRKKGNEEYFQIKQIPQIGSKLIYYKFNGRDKFEGESVAYQVVEVIHEIQEGFNSLYDEKVTVLLKKIGV